MKDNTNLTDEEVLTLYRGLMAEHADGQGYEAGVVAFTRALLDTHTKLRLGGEPVASAPVTVSNLPAFESPAVQAVYELLCDDQQPPIGEHWEGFVARRIVQRLSAPVAGEARPNLAPPKCPITGRLFFMALEHPELGMVPTYGGPYDSYTIPHLGGKPDQPWHERELRVYRYDHDLGGWLTDEVEVIPLRIVHEDVLNERHDAAPQASADARDRKWPMLSELHLHALMFAYNEGYSKAYDGRVFLNPFSENGSQAAAWQLGTDDGTEARAALASKEKNDE